MNLRTKLALALALLATVGTASVGLWSYRATSQGLDSEIYRSLVVSVQRAVDMLHEQRRGPNAEDQVFGVSYPYSQIAVQGIANGKLYPGVGAPTLPPTTAELALSTRASGTSLLRDLTATDSVGGRYRMLSVSAGSGVVVQAARNLSETDRVLDSLRNRTIVASVIVSLLASLLGWLVARQVTRRLVRLTGVAEHVASTGELDVPVPVGGNDEAGRLGTAFNEMLSALARSKQDQQRLVQDAGHELRTPLTSLRTNVSVLRRYEALAPDARARVLDDLDGETRELTSLVNEIVELATERRGDEPESEIPLGRLVERVAERARRRTNKPVLVDADATVIVGRPLALERAVSNLIDNAAKFSGETVTPIEVTVRAGRVEVLDRGPGLTAEDAPHVFDRFYRAVEARSRPGSGLGLSIVRDIVEAHKGTVFAGNRSGGGACIGFLLPVG